MLPVQARTLVTIAAAILLAGGLVGGFWLLWGVLADYINPKTAIQRKDLINMFVLSAAAVVGSLTALAAIGNLYISRRNLQQQRELNERRAQDDVLQDYFKQMGDLLTEQDLLTTDRADIKSLARALTFTLARRLDGSRKGQLIIFLYEAALIDIRKGKEPVLHLPLIDLSGVILPRAEIYYAQLAFADLSSADFSEATLAHCNFSMANLSNANLRKAPDLGSDFSGADLTGADLSGANLPGAKLTVYTLSGANFERAILYGAQVTDRSGNIVTDEELDAECKSLKGATLPNGQKYEEWLKAETESDEEG